MRLLMLSLSLVLLLSGCDESAANPQTNDQALTETPVKPVEAVALVNSKKQVGHRNFNSAKKILPEVFAGMEEDFYCGCKYTGKDVDFQSCGYEPCQSACNNFQQSASKGFQLLSPIFPVFCVA